MRVGRAKARNGLSDLRNHRHAEAGRAYSSALLVACSRPDPACHPAAHRFGARSTTSSPLWRTADLFARRVVGPRPWAPSEPGRSHGRVSRACRGGGRSHAQLGDPPSHWRRALMYARPCAPEAAVCQAVGRSGRSGRARPPARGGSRIRRRASNVPMRLPRPGGRCRST
mgnify:CR=1 FL=1